MSHDTTLYDDPDPTPYDLLVRVLRSVVGWIEASAVINGVAGATLDQQVAALASGWMPTRSWAWAVQASVYLADQIIVPLRAGESLLLDLADRPHALDFHRVEGRVRRHQRQPVHALYYYEGTGGVYPVALFKLHVMPGGARDILLSGGSSGSSPHTKFYVPDIGRGRSARFDVRLLHQMLVWCLQCAAPRLGMAEEGFRRRGLARLADVRKAVACHLIEHRGIDETARLLGLQTRSLRTYYQCCAPSVVDPGCLFLRAIRAAYKEDP